MREQGPADAEDRGEGRQLGRRGGDGLPPHFAPMSGEFGDALPSVSYASTQYLQYAIATVKDRALPRVARWAEAGAGPHSLLDVGYRARGREPNAPSPRP